MFGSVIKLVEYWLDGELVKPNAPNRQRKKTRNEFGDKLSIHSSHPIEMRVGRAQIADGCAFCINDARTPLMHRNLAVATFYNSILFCMLSWLNYNG